MKTALTTLATALMCTGLVLGQTAAPAPPATPTGPAAEVKAAYERVKPNILKAAEKMPPADYAYKPTPDVRTYARVATHIIEAQLRVCGAINNLPQDKMQPPAETAGKAAITAALQASFTGCDKAYATITDSNTTETFNVFGANRSRLGLLWGNVSHDNEQYATLALYLRLKGIVPPSSEK